MKKTITLLMAIFMLMTLSVTAFASDYGVMPCFNNTITSSATFVIDEDGEANINVKYIGYQNLATSGTVTFKIQKKSGSSWVDVQGASWNIEVTGFMYNQTYTYQLTSRGTYQLVYEYVVRGTGGTADVITGTIEDTY